jgi:ribosomal protein L28
MAKKVTAKKPLAGNRRSHSCRATKHTQKVNMVTVTLEDGTKVRTSAREKRTMNKLAA